MAILGNYGLGQVIKYFNDPKNHMDKDYVNVSKEEMKAAIKDQKLREEGKCFLEQIVNSDSNYYQLSKMYDEYKAITGFTKTLNDILSYFAPMVSLSDLIAAYSGCYISEGNINETAKLQKNIISIDLPKDISKSIGKTINYLVDEEENTIMLNWLLNNSYNFKQVLNIWEIDLEGDYTENSYLNKLLTDGGKLSQEQIKSIFGDLNIDQYRTKRNLFIISQITKDNGEEVVGDKLVNLIKEDYLGKTYDMVRYMKADLQFSDSQISELLSVIKPKLGDWKLYDLSHLTILANAMSKRLEVKGEMLYQRLLNTVKNMDRCWAVDFKNKAAERFY